MMRGVQFVIGVVVAVAAAASCSSSPDRDTASADNCFAQGWKKCEEEPYPFTESPPPVTPTAIDGTYTRTISEELAWAPGKCRRCPPYRLTPGSETLVFDSGRFFVNHEPPGFRGSGHFTESNHQIVLFNDANCIGMEGTYSWEIENGHLLFQAIEDECPYTRLRQRFFMAKPWAVAGED